MTRRRLLLAATVPTLACRRSSTAGFPGYAFVANEEGRSVAAIDLSSFIVKTRIPIEGNPSAVIAHPTRPAVYVLSPLAGTVHEIDLASFRVRRKARVAATAQSMRLAPDGETLWILSSDARTLARLALERLQVDARIRLPGAAEDFDLSRSGLAAISFPAGNAIALANLRTAAIQRTVAVGPDPRTIRFRHPESDPKQVLVGNCGNRTVTVVDVESGRVVVHLPVAVEPRNFCFKDDGGQLYITGPGMDVVAVIQPYQTVVYETRLAGRSPGAMAVSLRPEYLFIANTEAGNVTVMDVVTGNVIAVVAVGAEPRYVAITPDSRYALVLNHSSGDVAVIRIDPVSNKRAKLFTMIPVGAKPVSAVVRQV